MAFQIRSTTYEDLSHVMQIYETARLFMQRTGNAGQWTDGYPQESLIISDIDNGNSFVCLDENNEIIGTFFYLIGEEPTYSKIYEGAWLNNDSYGVIHRIASSGKRKGVGEACIRWCLQKCRNLRIDTHRDNQVMQNILQKLGFIYCGIIYLTDGAERLAYQKVMSCGL